MSRLATRFSALQTKQSKALVTFITAGDPNLSTTEEMIYLLEDAGADIIELGVPFSDPMADGPTIQLSSERALTSGTTLHGILDVVRKVRTRSAIPIILMGYLNPVHAYGYDRFCQDASEAGVDGVLLVDMPPEESLELTVPARRCGLDVIFLLTPTSDAARISAVERLGSGFVYYVTVTGVTGARTSVSTTLVQELSRVKQTISLPVMAGFGISTPAQAAEVGCLADGVVVGSAIVKLFEQYCGEQLKQKLSRYVTDLKQALS
ncbi:MAG: tryptophan synthase subunit alpha [Desulfuromonadaceae bacterium]|nr:tryptophan synthase subunit alpha [Desulfuromonadaceae bacterium]MDD2849889.1 tryptophan synthase subunit alpha [Desulfuromonadaceae bacterium]MDD4130704.1 tryptophan synthase subunit alpha [Desulfuromonadaceae bacterium]